MLRRMSLVACLAAVPLIASGCASSGTDSSKNFTGEQRAVAKTVEDLQSDGTKGKSSDVCDHLLSKSFVDQITKASKKSCSDEMDKTMGDVDAYDLDVIANGITITGTTATARVRSKAGDDKAISTLKLVKEGGRWRISAVGPAQPTK